jgi:hypothetical protein
MTLLLAVNLASFPSHLLTPGLLRQAVKAFTDVYTPLLVLACLAKIVWLDQIRPLRHIPAPQGPIPRPQ